MRVPHDRAGSVWGCSYLPAMRLLAVLVFRGVPVLGFLGLMIVGFDIGGVREPAIDAYISVTTGIGEYFGEQLKDAIAPTRTPTPTPSPSP